MSPPKISEHSMAERPVDADGQEEERASLIEKVITEVIRRREGGEQVDDMGVIVAHPELMPELALRLAVLHSIEEARRAAGQEQESGVAAANAARPTLPQIEGYEMVQKLGGGGQAVVYRAIHVHS